MQAVHFVEYSEIRAAVKIADLIEPLANAFVAYSRGETQSPPVVDLQFPEFRGETHIKAAAMNPLEHYCVKIVSCFYDNPSRSLPTRDGLMILLAADTGMPRAVLLDRGYLTDIRTAAAGAIAAKCLSRSGSTVAGVVGTGTHAFLQIDALRLVRQLESVFIWGRDPSKATELALKIERELGLRATAFPRVEEVIERADVVVTATPSREPLVKGRMLRAGQHVTAMGSDVRGKQELDVEALLKADVLAADSISQCLEIGELQHLDGRAERSDVQARAVELGDVLSDRRPGRRSDADITIADLTGLAVQDVVAADLAYRRTVERGKDDVT